MPLPAPYVARAYRGPNDHAAMVAILNEYREHAGTSERPTVEQFDVTYANLTNCDPATDIAVVETTAGEAVGYARTSWEDIEGGGRDCIVFGPVRPAHLAEPLVLATIGQVKSCINSEENAERGYRRGNTAYISTHVGWRNQGIASALHAMSLRELASRGMTESCARADTENPGGAFHVYTNMGFELGAYEAIYVKPVA